MIDCVKRGVDVFFLYDEIGSASLPRAYLDELGAAGVKHSSSTPPRDSATASSSISGTTGRASSSTAWRPGSAATTSATSTWASTPGSGPGATPMCTSPDPRRSSLSSCSWPTGTGPPAPFRSGAGNHGRRRAVMTSRPCDPVLAGRRSRVRPAVLRPGPERIEEAHLDCNPYFIPDPAVMAALRLAALRGSTSGCHASQVRQSGARPRDAMVHGAARRRGVKFYRHVPGFMHQKVFLVDDDLHRRQHQLRQPVVPPAVRGERAPPGQAFRGPDGDHAPPRPGEVRALRSASLRKASFPKRLAVSVARLPRLFFEHARVYGPEVEEGSMLKCAESAPRWASLPNKPNEPNEPKVLWLSPSPGDF